MSNEYEILEEQIGGLGAQVQESPDETPTPGLGKAKHFGVKHDTSEHESAGSMIRTGWIQLDMEEFGERAQFYPSDWTFYIKPATVSDIKNYSSIDEERPDQVIEIFNEMIKNNVKITSKSEGNISPLKINSWDRLFILLKIREYTFTTGELSFEALCDVCDEKLTYKLTSDSLSYDIPDQEIIDKYWDRETRTWTIDPREFNISGPVTKFHTPTLEVDTAIFNKTLEKGMQKKKINESLLKFLPWMVKHVSLRDDKLNERFIEEATVTYTSWGMEMFGLMDEFISNITVTQKNELRTICQNCGEEVISPIQFPNGLRGIFAVSGGNKRFGKK